MTIANRLHEAGLRLVGVPKTIDNDLEKTTSTFGFDTAVSFASECIDRLFSTATSHGRVLVVEVMGRYAGWIAPRAGAASGAHAILIPEIPFDARARRGHDRPARAARRQVLDRRRRRGRGAEGRHGVRARQGRRPGREARRDRRHRRRGPRGAHRQGGPHRRARPPAARRHADVVRPPPRPALRRRRRARPGGGRARGDGRPRPAERDLRADRRGDQPAEDRAPRLRHDPHRDTTCSAIVLRRSSHAAG